MCCEVKQPTLFVCLKDSTFFVVSVSGEGRLYPWRSCQIITGPCLNLWGVRYFAQGYLSSALKVSWHPLSSTTFGWIQEPFTSRPSALHTELSWDFKSLKKFSVRKCNFVRVLVFDFPDLTHKSLHVPSKLKRGDDSIFRSGVGAVKALFGKAAARLSLLPVSPAHRWRPRKKQIDSSKLLKLWSRKTPPPTHHTITHASILSAVARTPNEKCESSSTAEPSLTFVSAGAT